MNICMKLFIYFITKPLFKIEYGTKPFYYHNNTVLPSDQSCLFNVGCLKIQDFVIFINKIAFDYDISDEFLMTPELVDQMFPPAAEEQRTHIITTFISSPK